ncbi:MAG TPA: hypothetical protein VG778_00135, partial [Blastocatellia bacterium]|nr:hypothetical protein [Blastocatellia bacterium]
MSEAGLPSSEQQAALVDSFLEPAWADPILAIGPADHARCERTARRMLARYPFIANTVSAADCAE